METFPFVAIGNTVILEIHEVTKSKGGIHLPDHLRDKEDASGEMRTATVLEAGAQCRYVRAGDVVYWTGRMAMHLVGGRKVALGNENSNVVGIKRGEDGGPRFTVLDWQAGLVERLPDPETSYTVRDAGE